MGSDPFRVMSVVSKHVLLIDSVVRGILLVRVSVRVFLFQDPFNPYVDGKGVDVVEAKE